MQGFGHIYLAASQDSMAAIAHVSVAQEGEKFFAYATNGYIMARHEVTLDADEIAEDVVGLLPVGAVKLASKKVSKRKAPTSFKITNTEATVMNPAWGFEQTHKRPEGRFPELAKILEDRKAEMKKGKSIRVCLNAELLLRLQKAISGEHPDDHGIIELEISIPEDRSQFVDKVIIAKTRGGEGMIAPVRSC